MLLKYRRGGEIIAKYRKKPVVVEAFHFTKENFKMYKIPSWLKKALRKKQIELYSQYGGGVIGGTIKSLEGTHIVKENDYIIKGINGRIYGTTNKTSN